MKERSLVLFTLLAQLCVGAFLLLGLLDMPGFSLLSHSLPWIGFLIALALLASLFHLGSPGNAYRAAANWRSSWLSREILSSLAFAGCLVGFGALPSSTQLLLLGYGLASLCGLALIYCMARVYMLRTVEGWYRWTTAASFYSAALFLGSLAAGSVVLFTGEGSGALPWLGLLALFAFVIETLIWLLGLKDHRSIPIPWRDPLQFHPHPAWRSGLALIGLLAFGWAIFAYSGEGTARAILSLAGLAAAFVGEIMARARFYQLRQAQIL